MESGFKNEACERTKVFEESTKLIEEVESVNLSGNCVGGRAASTGYGPGSGTIARPPPLGPNR